MPEKRRNWVVVLLLCTGVMVAYVDRSNISVAIADSAFRSAFDLTDLRRGLLNSAFFWSYALLQIPAGWLADRIRVKPLYAGAFVLWSLVSAGTALVNSFVGLLILRVLLGIAESVVTPASLRWIRDHIDEQHRGLAIGLFQGGTKIGSAIGAPLAAICLSATGWRGMFAVLGLLSLVWLIPWLSIVRDEGSRHPYPSRHAQNGTVDLLRNPAMLAMLAGTFCYSYFAYFCVTWFPAYFVEHWGLTLNAMGFYAFLSFAGIAIMTPLAGWAADRVIAHGADPILTRKRFIVTGFILASTQVIGAYTESQAVGLFCASFALAALGLASANYWALTQSLVPAHLAARAGALQNFVSNIAGLVSPLVAGYLKHATGTYKAPIVTVAFVLLTGIAVYLWLVPNRSPRLQTAEV